MGVGTVESVGVAELGPTAPCYASNCASLTCSSCFGKGTADFDHCYNKKTNFLSNTKCSRCTCSSFFVYRTDSAFVFFSKICYLG